jgi:hypothetical protein
MVMPTTGVRGRFRPITERKVKTHLLAAAAILAATPAFANDYVLTCSPPVQSVGEGVGKSGGVTGTDVRYFGGGWRIVHHLAAGGDADRGVQYTISDTSSDGTHPKWNGVFVKNASLTMVGEMNMSADRSHPIYLETLYDHGHGDKIVMMSRAECSFSGGHYSPQVAGGSAGTSPQTTGSGQSIYTVPGTGAPAGTWPTSQGGGGSVKVITGRVVDQAHILSPVTTADLERKLADLEQKSRIQLVVAEQPGT